jgi:hypothetical protein
MIIAHREDTTALVNALTREGFSCEEVRGPYTDAEREYPLQIRCLINHQNAWQRISNRNGYFMVVEADFVPVRGLGELPLPFVPAAERKAMAWLYSVGPVIYHVDKDSEAIYGHNAGTVAYVLDSTVAKECLSLYAEEMKHPRRDEYRAWEVRLPIRLRREKAVRCYIPHRMYGEHGGITNREHSVNKVRGWHEADYLVGPLHYLPAYARGNKWVFYVRRFRGRARGIYRFICGKYFDGWPTLFNSREDRLLRFRIGFQRLF